MPSTILSDNGVTSGTAGIKTTGSNDGQLALQTTTAGGTATTALTIDTSQNTTLAGNATAKSFIPNNSTVPTNGLYLPATNAVGISTNSTNRIYIDSSGNVGIGTTSPAVRLHAYVTSSSATEIARFEVSGNTTPRIEIWSDGAGRTILRGSSAETALLSQGALPLLLGTNNTERARITSDGDLFIGCTARPTSATGGVGFSVQSSGRRFLELATTTTSNVELQAFINGNGQIGNISVSGSTTTYTTSSDYRLKENVAPMQNALGVISQLKPCTYTWKVDGSVGQGFIAHELAEVVPQCVTGEKDETQIQQYEVTPAVYEDVIVPAVLDDEGNEVEPERTEKQLVSEAVYEEREIPKYQGVDTSFLVATLTAAVQELKAINDAQATRIETLEAQNAAFEARLSALEAK